MSNRYLEKVADIRQYGRMARIAADAAVKNPMTTAFGAGGALDGALSTTRQGREGDARLALRAVRNTIVGAAKGAAAGKTLELAYQHLKLKAGKDANKYFHKVAMLSAPKHLVRGIGKAWDETTGPTRLSLGLGTAGLGVSTANFLTNRRRDDREARLRQLEIDQKALAALRGIHRELKAKPMV